MTPQAQIIFGKALAILAEVQAMDVRTMPRAASHSAYYAMFHAARALLQEVHGTVSSKHGTVHAGLEALLRNEPPEVARYAEEMRAAYDARLISDYLPKHVPPETAAEITTLAAGFVAWCARRLGVEVPPTAGP